MLQNIKSNNTLTLLQNTSLIKSRCNSRLVHVTEQVRHGILSNGKSLYFSWALHWFGNKQFWIF